MVETYKILTSFVWPDAQMHPRDHPPDLSRTSRAYREGRPAQKSRGMFISGLPHLAISKVTQCV